MNVVRNHEISANSKQGLFRSYLSKQKYAGNPYIIPIFGALSMPLLLNGKSLAKIKVYWDYY